MDDYIKEWQEVFHGSPVDNLTEFDTKYFGTENGSEYGRGIYTTKDLDEATMFGKGKVYGQTPHVYKVQIPADEYLMNVDIPYKSQSKYIKEAMKNWKQIPDKYRGQWVKDLLQYNEPGGALLPLYGMEEHFGDVEKWLQEMGIHGQMVQPTGWGSKEGNLYRIMFDPKYAKIIDKLFGGLDPWSASDMARMQGLDPRLILGSDKEKAEALQDYGYEIEYDSNGNPLLKSTITY